MPTYEFRCPTGHEFEKFYRSISGAPSEVACPTCGKKAERQMSAGGGLVFKGSGFYITDYGKDGKKPQTSPAKAGEAAAARGGGGAEPAGGNGGTESASSSGKAESAGGSGRTESAGAKGESKAGRDAKPSADSKSGGDSKSATSSNPAAASKSAAKGSSRRAKSSE
jgi:putative FmdB family regulatory protein